MARLVLEHLSKTFAAPGGRKVSAVARLNLTVTDGELLTLVGPSGSGKTTLLRLIAGLETADEGAISVGGERVEKLAPAARDVAMVFQSRTLFPHLTARENLASGLRWRKSPREEIESRVRQTAELLGLSDCLDQLPETLSGGQAQRVALGRALALRPRLLLLDEPLAQLDAPLRAQLRRDLKTLHRQFGFTMVFVTHDQAEAMTLGDRVAVMNGGALQQAASPGEIYEQPANRFVAGFFGTPPMNFVRGVIAADGGRLEFHESTSVADGAGFSLLLDPERATALAKFAGQEIILGIRPEHLALRTAGESPGGSIPATVELVEPLGAEEHIHLRTAAHPLVTVERARHRWQPGQRTLVGFAAAGLQFFDAKPPGGRLA
ncbi:MAG: ABC transporter ATP-binding protein [Verrucomicrobia bacterium]|nr:ABC transporter ATP-binding protein [Verrucomicrobiota bacterium]